MKWITFFMIGFAFIGTTGSVCKVVINEVKIIDQKHPDKMDYIELKYVKYIHSMNMKFCGAFNNCK